MLRGKLHPPLSRGRDPNDLNRASTKNNPSSTVLLTCTHSRILWSSLPVVSIQNCALENTVSVGRNSIIFSCSVSHIILFVLQSSLVILNLLHLLHPEKFRNSFLVHIHSRQTFETNIPSQISNDTLAKHRSQTLVKDSNPTTEDSNQPVKYLQQSLNHC